MNTNANVLNIIDTDKALRDLYFLKGAVDGWIEQIETEGRINLEANIQFLKEALERVGK
jgi:hypothetical protein